MYNEIPNGGHDIQEHPLYWVLPCGRCTCLTLRELYNAKPDQLVPQNSREAYREVASEMDFDVLGICPEEQLVALKEDLGVLLDEKWRFLDWELPDNGAAPCW